MTNAAIDDNGVRGLTGVSNLDGSTVMRVYVNPTTGALKVNNASTGAYPGGHAAARDENDYPTKIGVSSSDGGTLIKMLVNSSHEVLIDSN